jgi:hypothetical protein
MDRRECHRNRTAQRSVVKPTREGIERDPGVEDRLHALVLVAAFSGDDIAHFLGLAAEWKNLPGLHRSLAWCVAKVAAAS